MSDGVAIPLRPDTRVRSSPDLPKGRGFSFRLQVCHLIEIKAIVSYDA